ncbi:response regulator [Streptomyces sp. NPDC041068]|uniref:response regulator transcription factor n=1 Tax=Streptomyces sp. NPDC041068 TaxID=3155130 RepID=UPI003409406B
MINVFVVDDDFYVARIHSRYVDAIPGFRVVGQGHTAGAALAAVHAGGIDLVLLDHYLPDETGLALTRRIRALDHDIDVIMVTAEQSSALVRGAMRAGVLQYIVKPFTFDELRRRLGSYKRLRSALRHGRLDQAGIDRVLGNDCALHAAVPVPKGYNGRTAELVLDLFAETFGPLSAHEVADRIGISRSTAQRYLKYLEEGGKLQLTLRYGDAGRPEHLYQSQ